LVLYNGGTPGVVLPLVFGIYRQSKMQVN